MVDKTKTSKTEVKRTKYREEEMSDEELAREVRERQGRVDAIMEERDLAFQDEEKQILKWKAPARPYKERSREFYTTVGAIVILVSLILMFAKEFLLIAVVLALAFAVYALSSVKPEMVEHEITTRGIRTGGKFFRWDALGRFWFSQKWGQRMLNVETYLTFPTQLLMLLGDKEENEMKEILRKYVLNETPEPNFLDKSAKWLTEKVPLEES